MERIDIEETVKGILESKLYMTKGCIKMKDSLSGDLAADSLDIVDIVIACEQDFEISISDEEMEGLKDRTVKDLCDIVERHVNAYINN